MLQPQRHLTHLLRHTAQTASTLRTKVRTRAPAATRNRCPFLHSVLRAFLALSSRSWYFRLLLRSFSLPFDRLLVVRPLVFFLPRGNYFIFPSSYRQIKSLVLTCSVLVSIFESNLLHRGRTVNKCDRTMASHVTYHKITEVRTSM